MARLNSKDLNRYAVARPRDARRNSKRAIPRSERRVPFAPPRPARPTRSLTPNAASARFKAHPKMQSGHHPESIQPLAGGACVVGLGAR
jgi:hypothetical protein